MPYWQAATIHLKTDAAGAFLYCATCDEEVGRVPSNTPLDTVNKLAKQHKHDRKK